MSDRPPLLLPDDRGFGPDPRQKEMAAHLYRRVVGLPLVCPHGHVDPRLFADPEASFGSPTELILIPDHYALRMLYSQGISLESLGVERADKPRPADKLRPVDGGQAKVERDHRRIWQTFGENFHLFRGTPTGQWLNYELRFVFSIKQKLTGESAQDIYDQISARLASPDFRPRRLFERFNIEVLCTTDAAHDSLEHHRAIRESGWGGRVLPTFRPDGVINLDVPGWQGNLRALSQASGIDVVDYGTLLLALEDRRAFFKAMGATATDHAALTPWTEELFAGEADAIFTRALRGAASAEDATRFTGHMLMEMARMSIEDGLVMQFHPGSLRDYDPEILARFGQNKGADIPVQTEFTRNLRPLLNKYGRDPRLTLIVFTLDESAYARELAPLAGLYPALRLGPPWWFHDSPNGMARYRDQAFETAGLYNTVGFNDDTRAFPSIPARHDLWRRAEANWIAGLFVRGLIDMADAESMIYESAYGLATRAYKL